MNELIITTVVKEDLPVILDIQRKAFLEVARTFNLESMPQIEQTLESLAAEFSHYTFLKATLIETDHSRSLDSGLRRNDINEVVVGSVRAYHLNDTCYISRLVVLPRYQNRGIGKALMKEIENQFKKIVKRYELFTGSRDQRNQYLYNQLGYKSFKTEKLNHGHEPQASIGKRFCSKLWGLMPSALRDCSTNQFRCASLSESEFHNNEITFVFMEKSAQ